MTASAFRPALVYGLVSAVGAAAFLYPLWLPQAAAGMNAHAGDAPLLAAMVAALAVVAVTLEVRGGAMNGATIAVLGMLAAVAGILRLVDLPGGGSGLFFLVVLAGAAYGPRFGLLLGLTAMAVSAVITGGIGPWLPFQMLALAWMASGAGFLGQATKRLAPGVQVALLVAYGWVWGFLYGALLDLWFWPYALGSGTLAWAPRLGLAETARRFWAFYVGTSFAWDAAGAFTNAVLIAVTGVAILRALRRFEGRLRPAVELVVP